MQSPDNSLRILDKHSAGGDSLHALGVDAARLDLRQADLRDVSAVLTAA